MPYFFSPGCAKGFEDLYRPDEGGLDGFIAAEIIKKKIPMIVVTDDAQADYVLSGASLKADDRWYNVVFGGKDKNEGNVRLLDVKTKRWFGPVKPATARYGWLVGGAVERGRSRIELSRR